MGYADLGKIWGIAENLRGTIFIQPDGVQFIDFTGIYDSIPVSIDTGDVQFRDEGPWMSTELHGLVSSKKLVEIISEKNLRKKFKKKDGDEMEIELIL